MAGAAVRIAQHGSAAGFDRLWSRSLHDRLRITLDAFRTIIPVLAVVALTTRLFALRARRIGARCISAGPVIARPVVAGSVVTRAVIAIAIAVTVIVTPVAVAVAAFIARAIIARPIITWTVIARSFVAGSFIARPLVTGAIFPGLPVIAIARLFTRFIVLGWVAGRRCGLIGGQSLGLTGFVFEIVVIAR